jgi:hypothetical protein
LKIRVAATTKPRSQHHCCVDDRRDITGNEDEDIRSPAESVVSDGDPVHHIVGDVIQKDEPVRDAQEQIEPDIAPVGRENSFDVHGAVSQRGF